MEDPIGHVRTHLAASADVQRLAAEHCAQDVVDASRLMAASVKAGGKILLCGNGGSAADCQHVAAEFVSRLTADFVRPAIAAIALTTDTSFLTAYTNDFNVEGVFARQVEALGKSGDVLLAISTSGGSRNVLRAVEEARKQQMTVVVLMGKDGALASRADVAIKVPSQSTQHIQETLLSIEHAICHIVERLVYEDSKARAT